MNKPTPCRISVAFGDVLALACILAILGVGMAL